jgi:hypothetical protein
MILFLPSSMGGKLKVGPAGVAAVRVGMAGPAPGPQLAHAQIGAAARAKRRSGGGVHNHARAAVRHAGHGIGEDSQASAAAPLAGNRGGDIARLVAAHAGRIAHHGVRRRRRRRQHAWLRLRMVVSRRRRRRRRRDNDTTACSVCVPSRHAGRARAHFNALHASHDDDDDLWVKTE